MTTLNSVIENANILGAGLEQIAKFDRDYRQFRKDLAATTKRIAAIQEAFASLPSRLLELNAKIDETALWLDAKLDETALWLDVQCDEFRLSAGADELRFDTHPAATFDADAKLAAQAAEFDKAIATANILADRKLASLGVHVGVYAFEPKTDE